MILEAIPDRLTDYLRGEARQFVILTRHFFNRFFINDIVAFEEQMKEKTIAAIACWAASADTSPIPSFSNMPANSSERTSVRAGSRNVTSFSSACSSWAFSRSSSGMSSSRIAGTT